MNSWWFKMAIFAKKNKKTHHKLNKKWGGFWGTSLKRRLTQQKSTTNPLSRDFWRTTPWVYSPNVTNTALILNLSLYFRKTTGYTNFLKLRQFEIAPCSYHPYYFRHIFEKYGTTFYYIFNDGGWNLQIAMKFAK